MFRFEDLSEELQVQLVEHFKGQINLLENFTIAYDCLAIIPRLMSNDQTRLSNDLLSRIFRS